MDYPELRSKNHEIRKRETDFNIIYAFNGPFAL
jgi:hypothetical protein